MRGVPLDWMMNIRRTIPKRASTPIILWAPRPDALQTRLSGGASSTPRNRPRAERNRRRRASDWPPIPFADECRPLDRRTGKVRDTAARRHAGTSGPVRSPRIRELLTVDECTRKQLSDGAKRHRNGSPCDARGRIVSNEVRFWTCRRLAQSGQLAPMATELGTDSGDHTPRESFPVGSACAVGNRQVPRIRMQWRRPCGIPAMSFCIDSGK